MCNYFIFFFFFFQAEDGIRDKLVTGVQTCALPISIPSSNPFSGETLPASRASSRIGTSSTVNSGTPLRITLTWAAPAFAHAPRHDSDTVANAARLLRTSPRTRFEIGGKWRV